jgi:hypothetical protein
MAWQRLKKDLAKGPIRLTGAEEAAQRLNNAPSVADTVDKGDVYFAAGLARDGIVEEIKREMARRFPEHLPEGLDESGNGAVAYAYLRAAVKFTHPFLVNEHPLDFVAPDGSKTVVLSFGLPYRIRRSPAVAQQVEVLHATWNQEHQIETFVLDLCKDTSPYQALVARIPGQPTLGALLADLEKRIAGSNDKELTRPLRFLDSMVVPHLRFRIRHRFKDLEGKTMPDQGLVLVKALQQIDFRLDASGATLTSESALIPLADPRSFACDRPFLVVLRKRGVSQPFFVLWVENGELLEPSAGRR